MTGQRTVPNIYIGKQHIGGNSDLQSLQRGGGLLDALKAAGAL
jgi:glutaredoxin 3